MTAAMATDWLRQMLWVAAMAAAPVVGAMVVVGFLVAIVQAATQVNDQAVAFGPKAAALIAALVVSGPWIFRQMTAFARLAIVAVETVGR